MDYVVYIGDEFCDLGTLEELSERLNKPIKQLKYYTYPSYHKRKGKIMRIYKIEEDWV